MGELDKDEQNALAQQFNSAVEHLSGLGIAPEQKQEFLEMMMDVKKSLSIGTDSQETNHILALLAINIEIAKHGREQEKLAATDPLTGLSNKTNTFNSVDRMIARSGRDGGTVGVFYIDLTKFKALNDALSHIDGDNALIIVADRLKHLMREGDIVGRDGGDEFVIAVKNPNKDYDFKAEQYKITKFFEDGIIYTADNGDEYPIGGDVGLAIAAEGEKGKALIKRADYIMKHAKQISHSKLEGHPPQNDDGPAQ